MQGGPFKTKREAKKAARRWSARLKTAFARLRIGADFGDREPKPHLTPFGFRFFGGTPDAPIRKDVHGVDVFECEPAPSFLGLEVNGGRTKSREAVVDAVKAAGPDVIMTKRRRLAYDLFSASFFGKSADVRFLMLWIAVETLIRQKRRSEAAIGHVDKLISDTKDSRLCDGEIRSILDSLKWLGEESIGQAGRRLAKSLGDRRYMDETPVQFFSRCYDMRNSLVHGSLHPPTLSDVDARASKLECFVSDLLSRKLLVEKQD